MYEILQAIIKLIEERESISALTGSIISDPPAEDDDSRVYGYPGTTVIAYNSSKPASIVYRSSFNGMPGEFSFPSQRPDGTLYLQVCAINATIAEQISEELMTLLNGLSLLVTANWKVGVILAQGINDESIEGTPTFPLIIRNVALRMKEVFKRVS